MEEMHACKQASFSLLSAKTSGLNAPTATSTFARKRSLSTTLASHSSCLAQNVRTSVSIILRHASKTSSSSVSTRPIASLTILERTPGKISNSDAKLTDSFKRSWCRQPTAFKRICGLFFNSEAERDSRASQVTAITFPNELISKGLSGSLLSTSSMHSSWLRDSVSFGTKLGTFPSKAREKKKSGFWGPGSVKVIILNRAIASRGWRGEGGCFWDEHYGMMFSIPKHEMHYNNVKKSARKRILTDGWVHGQLQLYWFLVLNNVISGHNIKMKICNNSFVNELKKVEKNWSRRESNSGYRIQSPGCYRLHHKTYLKTG